MADSKIRVVLVSHGEQSKGMLNTVQMLLGEQTNIAAYSLYPEQTIDDLTKVLREEIEKYGAENFPDRVETWLSVQCSRFAHKRLRRLSCDWNQSGNADDNRAGT